MATPPNADVRLLADLISRPATAPLAALDDRLLALAGEHGVTPLLADTLHAAQRLSTLPADIHARLLTARREAVVLDALRRAHERATIGAMVTAGIDAIVFKGAALAVSHYSSSWLRPRGDVDVLVPIDQVAAAQRVLERAGCHKLPRPEGDAVTYQTRYAAWTAGTEVAYDLHWRIADPHAFTNAIDLDGLRQQAVPAPTFGARMPDPVHALLIACVHRAAHHFDSDRLLLLCDIDRLAGRLGDDEWRRVVDLACAGGIRAVCARGLDLAAVYLRSPYPDWVRRRLDEAGATEPAARYVSGPMRRIDVLASDLRCLPTWRKRVGLMREHVCPPRDVLAARYGANHPLLRSGLVMLLYADRLVRGLTRWFRPVH